MALTKYIMAYTKPTTILNTKLSALYNKHSDHKNNKTCSFNYKSTTDLLPQPTC